VKKVIEIDLITDKIGQKQGVTLTGVKLPNKRYIVELKRIKNALVNAKTT
jgi:hypothetical protein